MKKNTVYILIAIQIIIILLFSTLLVLFINKKISFDSIGGSKLGEDLAIRKEQEYDIGEIEQFKLDFTSDKISIYESDSDKIKVIQKGNANLQEADLFEDKKSGNLLEVFQSKKVKIHLFNFAISEMEIYLPKGYNQNLSIKNVSGKVEIQKDLELQDLEVKTTSGKIEISNLITANKVTLESVSGKIETNETIKVQEFNGSTTSGKIEMNVLDANDYTIKSTSGKIELTSLTGKGQLKATSGSIAVDYFNITGDCKINNTSGKVYLLLGQDSNCNINAQSTSGKITLPEQIKQQDTPMYQLDIKTMSGSITVDR